MYEKETAKQHFLAEVLNSLSDSLASILAVGDEDVRKELAATFLVSSLIILSNSVGKDTVKQVTDALKEQGLI
jgi:hypothetical protein